MGNRRRERGSVWLLRLMAVFSLRVGRRAGRLILYVIAAYFFLFAPRARRASIDVSAARARAPADERGTASGR